MDSTKGLQAGDPDREAMAAALMTETALTLTDAERQLVEKTVEDHCRFRGWILHAVNCRTQHAHVVVSADTTPKETMNQLKAWCTRRLKALQAETTGQPVRENWWTEGGDKEPIYTQDDLNSVIDYVLNCQ